METLAIAPDEDGYTFVEPGSFLYQELEGGLPRTRADLINASKTVGVQWTVGVADYQYLCNFNSANLSNDSEPFLIPLFIDEVEAKDYEAIILPGTFGLVSQSGETYVVGAQLEVIVTPATDDEYDDGTSSNAGTGVTGAGYYAGSTEIASGAGVQPLFGSYHLNGKNAILRRQNKIINPIKGSYVLNGQSIILTRDRKIVATKGSYALNGQAANIHKNIQALTAAYGSYALNGQAAALTYNGPSDPNFANVVLLMHCEGTDGGIVFTDNSSYNHTIFQNNSTTSATQAKYGSTSAKFDGNHYIAANNAAEFNFGSSNFTVELFFFPTTIGSNGVLFAKIINTGYFPVELFINTSGQILALAFDNAGTPNLLGTITSSALSINNWYHIAFTRNGNTFTLWINGVSAGTFTSSATLFNDTGGIQVGMYTTGASPIYGYMDEIRVTIGTCRYTSAFTPPSTAFPNSGGDTVPFSQVQLLLHGDGSNGGTVINDSSGANRTATIVGTVVTSTTSPAVGTASLAFTAPSRVYFPQSTSLDLGSSDFTIQFRVKYDSLPTASVPGNLISKWFGTSSGQQQYRIYAEFTGNNVVFRYTIGNVETPITWYVYPTVTTGVWYLFEFCRVGGTIHFFIDGIKKIATGSDSISGALDAISSVTSIGAMLLSGSTVEGHPGNIDELRLVIGTGLYTADHTPYLAAYPNS